MIRMIITTFQIPRKTKMYEKMALKKNNYGT